MKSAFFWMLSLSVLFRKLASIEYIFSDLFCSFLICKLYI